MIRKRLLGLFFSTVIPVPSARSQSETAVTTTLCRSKKNTPSSTTDSSRFKRPVFASAQSFSPLLVKKKVKIMVLEPVQKRKNIDHAKCGMENIDSGQRSIRSKGGLAKNVRGLT